MRRVFGPVRVEITPAGESFVMSVFMICANHKYNSSDHFKKSERGGSCSLNGGEEKCI